MLFVECRDMWAKVEGMLFVESIGRGDCIGSWQQVIVVCMVVLVVILGGSFLVYY